MFVCRIFYFNFLLLFLFLVGGKGDKLLRTISMDDSEFYVSKAIFLKDCEVFQSHWCTDFRMIARIYCIFFP